MTQVIVRVSSDSFNQCAECSETIDGAKHFEKGVNHYLSEHHYKLLHIGTETTPDEKDHSPWHRTVAILGK